MVRMVRMVRMEGMERMYIREHSKHSSIKGFLPFLAIFHDQGLSPCKRGEFHIIKFVDTSYQN